MVKLIKLKKLQKLNLCYAWRPALPLPPPPPPPHTHTGYCPYGHYTMGCLYLNLFLGSELFTCSHRTNDKWDKGTMETHPKVFAVNATAVNCVRWQNDNAFDCRFKLREKIVKKAYPVTERQCTSSAFTGTFSTMTVMTGKSPTKITPVAYKKW